LLQSFRFDPLITPIIFLRERERIGDTVRSPPRQLITVMVLSHVMLVFQRQRPTVVWLLAHAAYLVVFE
jgi:hypothetical protein